MMQSLRGGAWKKFSVSERLKMQSEANSETGCLLMKKTPTEDGYVQIRVDGKLRLAHRVAFELAGGILLQGLELDHTCSRRNCVNPAHLEAVTREENCARAYERGRVGKREIKMTRESAKQLREDYRAGGVSHKKLAEKYGVARTTVTNILNNETWNEP